MLPDNLRQILTVLNDSPWSESRSRLIYIRSVGYIRSICYIRSISYIRSIGYIRSIIHIRSRLIYARILPRTHLAHIRMLRKISLSRILMFTQRLTRELPAAHVCLFNPLDRHQFARAFVPALKNLCVHASAELHAHVIVLFDLAMVLG